MVDSPCAAPEVAEFVASAALTSLVFEDLFFVTLWTTVGGTVSVTPASVADARTIAACSGLGTGRSGATATEASTVAGPCALRVAARAAVVADSLGARRSFGNSSTAIPSAATTNKVMATVKLVLPQLLRDFVWPQAACVSCCASLWRCQSRAL